MVHPINWAYQLWEFRSSSNGKQQEAGESVRDGAVSGMDSQCWGQASATERREGSGRRATGAETRADRPIGTQIIHDG